MDAREDERREVPDGFLGAELAEAAAGEAANGSAMTSPLKSGGRPTMTPMVAPA
jgi:hypothetical protein